jgi:UDP-N-acetylmuramoyl-L-alanyl-D-glutamate--2,6-diaminopimelate ligase
MQLVDLIQAAGLAAYAPALPPVVVQGLAYDSRLVRHGSLFVAVPGTATDGPRFVQQAVDAGACAVVVERSDVPCTGVPCLVVPSSRAALADLAAAFSGFPARRLFVTGITGTDGKTTSSFLLSHVLERLGRTTGLLSTVAFKLGDRWLENRARQSTPESLEIQAALATMLEAGVSEAVVEATSHGLVLERVRRCAFDAALITKLTSEHLDFHGTREAYIAAKARLLAALTQSEGKHGPQVAAINADDEGSARLIGQAPGPVITFGLGESAALRATAIHAGPDGSTFHVEVDGRSLHAATPLPGLFNVYNCLGVLALVYGRGLDLAAAIAALPDFAGVTGRMHAIRQGQPFSVIVDYAHTADSLQKVLQTLRPLTRGRLIAVFGSAGDRDREKRPAMGRVAARYADYAVFTDEDPRTEPSLAVIDAIAAGAQAAGWHEGLHYLRLADRAQAIAHAVHAARAGDVVLLAGKGHEQSILVGGRSLPWDEEAAAREALRSCGYTG